MSTSWIYGSGGGLFFPPPMGLRNVINVVTDFGAVSGSASDQSTAFQNAFEAAFGPFSSPNTDATQNIPLLIPSGNYVFTKPIYLSSAGGRIFSDGSVQFDFQWDGSTVENVTGDGTQTLLMCDGLRNMVIENLDLTITAARVAQLSNPPIGLYLTDTGTRGATENNFFYNLDVSNFHYGVLVKGSQGCANNSFIGSSVQSNHLSGVRIDNPGAFNNVWIGGGAATNADGGTARPEFGETGNLGGGFSVIQGSLHMADLSNDQVDAGHIAYNVNSGVRASSPPPTRADTVAQSDGRHEIILNVPEGNFPFLDGTWMRVNFVEGTTEANGLWQVLTRKFNAHPPAGTDDTNSVQLVGSNFVNAYTGGTFNDNFGGVPNPAGATWVAYNWDIVVCSHATLQGARSEGNNCILLAGTDSSFVCDDYQPGGFKTEFINAQLSTNGLCIMRGSQFRSNANENVTSTGDSHVAVLGTSGRMVLDGMQGVAAISNPSIVGDSGSKIYLRNCVFPTLVQTNLPTSFAGTKVEDIATTYS